MVCLLLRIRKSLAESISIVHYRKKMVLSALYVSRRVNILNLAHSKKQNPVKVSKYTKSNGRDIVFNQYTKVIPVESADINFEHSAKLLVTGIANSIASLTEVAAEQVISVKAEVSEISGVKIVHTQHQGTLKKQEVLIRDTTSSIKVILWETNVEKLEKNKTYLLKNLKVKVSNKERYLNTPKGEEFIATETTPFKKPLVQVQQGLFDMVSSTISGKIIGIQQTTNTRSCISCKKQVLPCPDDDDLGECQSCKLVQMLTACGTQWYLRLLVQSSTNQAERKRLSFYNQEVQQLMDVLNITLNLDTATERDMVKTILKANQTVEITFDTFTGKVTAITDN